MTGGCQSQGKEDVDEEGNAQREGSKESESRPIASARRFVICPICECFVAVHQIRCARCDQPACLDHFVMGADFKWLCGDCVALLSGG